LERISNVEESRLSAPISSTSFVLIAMAVSTTFKAAVLVNSISALDDAFRAAFQKHIISACPGAQVDFFDPIGAQIYPEPGEYDLIVLTGGGTADATAEDIPWVLKMRDFLRTTVEKCPTQKIVGVCWGHQVIHIAFEGAVGPMDTFEVCISLWFIELGRLMCSR
jgi:hypothetical protein